MVQDCVDHLQYQKVHCLLSESPHPVIDPSFRQRVLCRSRYLLQPVEKQGSTDVGWWWSKDKLLDFVEINVTTVVQQDYSRWWQKDDNGCMLWDWGKFWDDTGKKKTYDRIMFHGKKHIPGEKNAASRGCLGLLAVKSSWCKRRLV